MTGIHLQPIGVISSPYQERGEAPRQGRLSPATSEILIFPGYAEGLRDISDHPRLFILYWGDRSRRDVLTATPPHERERREHGVFATRSPERPNPVALCLVDLVGVAGNKLTVRGLDALDGSPLIDIKPFHRDLDCPDDEGSANATDSNLRNR
ncbi:MAG TPA: tRNA (N6-threonylcarbamoyladenosine(37)-N6)-methyltransferase TrmO [Methanomicrobiales archaeon]|nr:tRNA (N6-threonylcarbamoyladenosine(37)-N6)-methyltransferase TrmO [Methanomicrobiales archaeon]